VNILNWFDILKNQVLSNTSLGSSMDWNNPEIEDEDDDCIKKLMEIYERAKIHTQRQPTENKKTIVRTYLIEKETNNRPSEKNICEVLNDFKNADNNYFRIFHNLNFYYRIRKNNIDNEYKNPNRNTMIYIDNRGLNLNFKFFVQVAYNIMNETIQNEEEHQREYIDLCKKVFGEYYNSTYEEVFGSDS